MNKYTIWLFLVKTIIVIVDEISLTQVNILDITDATILFLGIYLPQWQKKKGGGLTSTKLIGPYSHFHL